MRRFIPFAVLALFAGIIGAALAQPIQSTLNYFSSGSAWVVGGTLNIVPGGALQYNGTTVNLARGVTTITGTADVTTGLGTVVACSATIAADASINANLTSITVPTQTGGTAGHVTINVWKPTSNANPTPIASTAATATAWVCVGT